MFKAKFGMIVSALLVACGCTQGTPGGPGVQAPTGTQNQVANKPVIGEARDTFSLRLPMLSTSLKQGETKAVSVAIQRGTNFDQDVTLGFTDLPNGVTIDPMSLVVKHSDKDVKFNVIAADTAALGDFAIKVTGRAEKGGPDAVNEFKIAVSAK